MLPCEIFEEVRAGTENSLSSKASACVLGHGDAFPTEQNHVGIPLNCIIGLAGAMCRTTNRLQLSGAFACNTRKNCFANPTSTDVTVAITLIS